SSRRRHTISKRDWSSDVCSSDLRKFPGTFQNTVFQDVCHSRAVCRRRAECNIEYFVFVIIFHQKYPRPAFFMAEQITSGMNVFRSEERRVGKKNRFQ